MSLSDDLQHLPGRPKTEVAEDEMSVARPGPARNPGPIRPGPLRHRDASSEPESSYRDGSHSGHSRRGDLNNNSMNGAY